MKKILRSSRHVGMRGRPSCLVTLFLLCSSCLLLSVTANDFVECTDPLPDEVLDILGLIQIQLKDLVILFVFIFLVIKPDLTHIHPTSDHPLPVDLTITSKIIPCTVIRI